MKNKNRDRVKQQQQMTRDLSIRLWWYSVHGTPGGTDFEIFLYQQGLRNKSSFKLHQMPQVGWVQYDVWWVRLVSKMLSGDICAQTKLKYRKNNERGRDLSDTIR